MEKGFKCPLCESILSESRYYQIVGVWEEKKKFENDLKKQLAVAKEMREKLLIEKKEIQEKLVKEREEIKKRFEGQFEKQKLDLIKKSQEEAKKLSRKEVLELEGRQKKELVKAKKEFLEKGKEHEKSRTKKLSDMLQGKMEKLEGANKKILESDKIIKELKEQLKKGTTPQVEGLNLEEELVKELRSKFPEDEIIRKGHGGDVYHYVKYNGKKIGFILYECKKTQIFQKAYVHQIKNDVVNQNATYGVLVTTAPEKGKAGFWVKDGILIVHPWGTIHLAEVLRKWIIDLHSLKLDKKELSECAKKLFEYIKGDKFKNCIEDTIDRARQLHEMLKKEITTHKNMWEGRHKHYSRIYQNSQDVEKDSKAILRNEKEVGGEPELIVISEIGRSGQQLLSIKDETYEEKINKIKGNYSKAYEPWEEDEEKILLRLFKGKNSIKTISDALKRQPGAIRSRLKKLGVLSDEKNKND